MSALLKALGEASRSAEEMEKAYAKHVKAMRELVEAIKEEEMPIEVVKKGNLHPNYCWKPTCNVCQSELLVSAADHESIERVSYAGSQREPNSAYDYVQCACPVCGATIRLQDWAEIPEVVKRMQLQGVKQVPG